MSHFIEPLGLIRQGRARSGSAGLYMRMAQMRDQQGEQLILWSASILQMTVFLDRSNPSQNGHRQPVNWSFAQCGFAG